MDAENNNDGDPVPSSAAATEPSTSPPVGEEKATDADESDRVLRFGDLVRIVGKQVGKPDNRGSLGKILRSIPVSEVNIDAKHLLSSHPFVYDVELILGGKLTGWQRPTLQYTTAAAEGMTGEARRRKRKPTAQTTITTSAASTTTTAAAKKKQQQQGPNKKAKNTKASNTSKRGKAETGNSADGKGGKSKRQKATSTTKGSSSAVDFDDIDNINNNNIDIFERHRRDFERSITRLEKSDIYGFFTQPDIPAEFDECYDSAKKKGGDSIDPANDTADVAFPNHPPFNFVVLRKRMEMGRYVLDQELLEVEDRVELIEPYYESKNIKMPVSCKGQRKQLTNDFTVLHKKGINWDLFRMDVRGMCDQAVRRNSELVDDDGTPGTLSHSAKKIKDLLDQIYDKTGKKQMTDIELSNDRYRFTRGIDTSTNNEAAFQGKWKKDAFEERKYERLTSNVVCAGLSSIDEKIAQYELNTSLKDSFLGLSYTYDDTGQSEGWMKTILNESGETEEAASAAMAALETDDGVIKAQVSASMQALLIAVQDRVMTDMGVLSQRELRSANWDAGTNTGSNESVSTKQIISKAISKGSMPDIIEQPVWGMDCYTRRNISICIETEFDADTAIIFIEKWLLPAINACPVDMAHNIHNAACILEGIPFDTGLSLDQPPSTTLEKWGKTLLGAALTRKIQKTAPPWLASAAQLLRRAVASLGTDFFRIHPKGHGSIVLCPRIEPNRLVTFYRGEVYPSWRWGEKTDAISLIQERKGLKPRLPDFYNMALERPQTDPRGYGLLFVDASRKSGYGSMLSHSCTPSCEVRVAAVDGKVALAMTTLRELTIGDEVTFDYNAVTESLHEYQEAVCLCGHGHCRGSFLHFATAECYQQVLNRNSPVAVRLSQLIKGSAKRVMSEDDSGVLKRHGFQTAAFGAVSVNRRYAVAGNFDDQGLDSLDFVPIWLRTFVAEILRYIEYERRALPIALICNDLDKGDTNEGDESDSDDGASESETEEKIEMKQSKKDSKPIKGNKPEPTFFFFANKNRAKFLPTVMKQKENAQLKGTALENQLKKVASAAWKELDEKSKSRWKNKALAEWEANGGHEKARLEEERLKRVAMAKSQPSSVMNANQPKDASKAGKNSKKRKKKTDTKKKETSFPAGGMSFQAADAEGVSAMEQRIQQLTQALSRVGRVLDRHREESLRKLSNDITARSMDSPAELRALVHSPVVIMTDSDVVAWMWNHPDGVVNTLMEMANSDVCVSPSMMQHLQDTYEKYSELSGFGTPWNSESGEKSQHSLSGAKGRETLNKALLEFRKVLLDGMAEMASEIRQRKKKKKEQENVDEAQKFRKEIENLLNEMVGQVVERIEGPEPKRDLPTSTESSDPWLENFNKRFKIEKAADLLLLYARTSTFFRLQTYEPLRSTPIEVYAREIGNSVPRSVMDTVVPKDGRSDVTFARTPKPTGICAPDDIVSEVVVDYQGDYVLSQLLQWYNAGVEQKPGLPDMLGCALLPTMKGCWTIDSTKAGTSASDRTTTYRSRVRPKLVEWLTDAHKRGNPWSDEIRRHFVEKENDKPIEKATNWIPLGSPVLDLLVTGDDSNILDIRSKMGRSARSETSDGILSSVDEGRPAQAVSNWVQCEKRECQKWRRIPWHVDIDMLSEHFVCSDNLWNPSSASCEAPEDSWDEHADAWIDADGNVKVEEEITEVSVPVTTSGMPLDETEMRVLDFMLEAQFDVFKVQKERWVRATVIDTDLAGECKRVLFRYKHSGAEDDEWIELDSGRIAPFLMHTNKQSLKRQRKKQGKKAGVSVRKKTMDEKEDSGVDSAARDGQDDSFEGDTETSGDESMDLGLDKQKADQSDDDGLNDFGDDDASGESRETGLENNAKSQASGAVGSTLTIVTDEGTSPNLYGDSESKSPVTGDPNSQIFSIPKKRNLSPEPNRIPKKKPSLMKEPSTGTIIPAKESPSSRKQSPIASKTASMKSDPRHSTSMSSIPTKAAGAGVPEVSVRPRDPRDPRIASHRNSVENSSSPKEKESKDNHTDAKKFQRHPDGGSHHGSRGHSKHDPHYQGFQDSLHQSRTNARPDFSSESDRQSYWLESRKAHLERPSLHPKEVVRNGNQSWDNHGSSPRFSERDRSFRNDSDFIHDRDRRAVEQDGHKIYRQRWNEEHDRPRNIDANDEQFYRQDGDRYHSHPNERLIDRNRHTFEDERPRSMERWDDHSGSPRSRIRERPHAEHSDYTRHQNYSPRRLNESYQDFARDGYSRHEEPPRQYDDDIDRRPPMGYDLDYNRRHRKERSDHDVRYNHSHSGGYEYGRRDREEYGREDPYYDRDRGAYAREESYTRDSERDRDRRRHPSPEKKPEKVKRKPRGYAVK